MTGNISPPSFRESPWAWAIGGLIVGVVLTVIGIAWQSLPPSSPIEIQDIRTSRPVEGVWRVEMDVHISSKCRSVIVDRSFAPDSGDVWRQAPKSAYVDGIGKLPYAVSINPGKLAVWHEYAMKKRVAGTHILRVYAFDCESGFSGEAVNIGVPFDWR